MKLRSGLSRPRMKGKNVRYRESSEEDNENVTSDSDYSGISDQSQDFLSMVDADTTKEVLDLNQESNDSDSDNECEVPKRRKGGFNMKRGQQNHNSGLHGDSGEEHEGHKLELDCLALKNTKNKKGKRKVETKPTLMWEVWEEEHWRWVEENMTKDFDLDHQNEVMAETCEAPSDLIMPLLRYQKEWLVWALKQEESAKKGGILADEMGMGKTIQAISLVLAKREIDRALDGLAPSSSSSMGLPAIKGTLVICPLVAVIQWVSEIDRFTAKGSNKVLVYHGANRGKSLHEFSEYDFVITTYSIVEAEYRKHVMPPKQKCQWCGKLFNERKISIHLKYFCGPNALRTDKQSKKRRKGSKLGQTMGKKEKISDTSKANKFESIKKKKACKKTLKQDNEEKEQGTSFAMEKSAGSEQGLPTRKSILHSVKWNRIILDEVSSIESCCFRQF